jgi:hypothetical protein
MIISSLCKTKKIELYLWKAIEELPNFISGRLLRSSHGQMTKNPTNQVTEDA